MYGGYGGLGSYGSSYGSYGGLGSSYGGYGGLGSSSYSSRYGGMQSNRRVNTQTTQQTKGQKLQQQGDNPSNPADPKQQMQKQQNQDKKVVQQWFKMMGGLRSILQLGFAFLALTNFCITTSQLVKKMMAFSKQKSLSMAHFLEKKMPTKTIKHLMSPQRRVKTMKIMLLNMMRIFAAFLLVLGLKMRRDMKRDAKKKYQDMMEQLEKLKENQVEMEDQSQIEERQKGVEQGLHDANL